MASAEAQCDIAGEVLEVLTKCCLRHCVTRQLVPEAQCGQALQCSTHNVTRLGSA